MKAQSLSTELPYNLTLTQDWFSGNIRNWEPFITSIKNRCSSPRVLEIGSWEGRSAVHLLSHLCNPTGSIVCIDHFDLLETAAGRERYAKIQHNLSVAAGSGNNKFYRILAQFSFPALMMLLEEEMEEKEPGYDWIYIDGSHEADDTFLDGELCWRLARKGAIVIFDDYHWASQPENSAHHPRRGIEGFLKLHEGEYERLTGEECYQVVLRKIVDMRIGFLVPGKDRSRLKDALGYGINVALAIDSSYVRSAAVTIYSAVDCTPGRISIYIVDCGGLTEEDKALLRQSLPRSDGVTLSFLPLPQNSIAVELGPIWAKLDLDTVLPIERVLYLDADTLVRKDLTPLWESDLGDRTIGAIQDVGHPMGNDPNEKHPYFNAGVMLMNLTKIRESSEVLRRKGREMKDVKFRDQDVLNIHFKDWVPFSLQWNGQGLGTYARYPSPERSKMEMKEMDDPAIVHFTGPVNPSVVEVLNPYVQPPTAKPWGYIGAPGHPYSGEWWKVFKKTPFRGYGGSEERSKEMEDQLGKAIDFASKKFRENVGEFQKAQSDVTFVPNSSVKN